ncbi:restriction endonuclease [Gordonia sp. TBRC 11910]|uniref:Restriction endonuclease n=1 Tax=Gordonia asplenii TaxID=2725283 RepID=A0A848KKZ8_9ACTN|nr:restriction endonuclease [Gordonia asplenii]NMN99773.1 restriction endonuclease [Gordonia asplenii]
MTPICLTEGGDSQFARLSAHEFEALRSLAIVVVTPTLDAGWYEIAPGRKIGAVAVGAQQVVVRPKIADLNRLIFLLGYSGHRSLWRDDAVDLIADDELLPALAEAFSRLATLATAQGLLQGYRTTTDTLPVLRGRILAGEQMTRRYGLPLPLSVEYDDFTVDIVENRLLLAATLRMLRVRGISVGARRRLQRLHIAMSEVSPPTRGLPPPRWQPTRLNARYHDALRLAQIVLSAQSFEQRIGDLTVTGFMFDMWRVFEDFICAALGEVLTELGGKAVTQHRIFLDEADHVVMKPDLLWLGHDRRPAAVIDAKYKAERPEGFPDADLYQMLAYCTTLGLQDGHLVYAKGNETAIAHSVRRSRIAIHCHAMDLALPPEELLGEVDKVADRIKQHLLP